MKICELNKGCNSCGLSDYCNNEYPLCKDYRFPNIEIEQYVEIAKNAVVVLLKSCRDCMVECFLNCEHKGEAKNETNIQIADFVYSEIMQAEISKTIGILRDIQETANDEPNGATYNLTSSVIDFLCELVTVKKELKEAKTILDNINQS